MTATTPDPTPEDLEQETATPQEGPTRVKAPRWKKDNLPPTTPSSSPEAGPGDGSGDDLDSPAMSDELPEPEPTKSGSSRTSSRAEKKALRDAVRVAFGGATTAAHELLVKDEYGKHVQLFLADEQDLEAVAEPGGNLLSRRMGDAPVSPDAADAIALLIALVGYGLKQLSRIRYARHLREQKAAVNGHQLDLTGVGEQLQEQPDEPAAYAAPGA